MIKRNILLNPGPATTTDSVKYAQVVPDICPREKEFGDLMRRISKGLLGIVQAQKTHECIFFGGSGTAGVESVISSTIPYGKKVLIVNNGAYGKRMREIAQVHGIPYIEYSVEYGSSPDLGELEKILEGSCSDISAIAMVHHETTTGILNPINKVGNLAKKYGCDFIVDAVSSFAGVPFSLPENNVDFAVSTSNKCIQAMPGVCFVFADKNELEKTKDYPKRTFYLDLYRQYAYLKNKNQTRFTPPVQTFYSLAQAIEELKKEGGVEARHTRYSQNWGALVSGMRSLGFRRFKPEVPQSKLLTTFYEPDNPKYSFQRMHDFLYKKGFTIYPGKIQERTFRIANIGAIDRSDIKDFLAAMTQTLKEMGISA